MINKLKKWLKDKKASFLTDNLGWLILAVAVLVVVVIGYFILSGKGAGAITQIKNLFRFR